MPAPGVTLGPPPPIPPMPFLTADRIVPEREPSGAVPVRGNWLEVYNESTEKVCVHLGRPGSAFTLRWYLDPKGGVRYHPPAAEPLPADAYVFLSEDGDVSKPALALELVDAVPPEHRGGIKPALFTIEGRRTPIGTALHDAKKGETVDVLLGPGTVSPEERERMLKSLSTRGPIVLPPSATLDLVTPPPSPEAAHCNIAAAGTTRETATPLTAALNRVTKASPGSGVCLPAAAETGTAVMVFNNTALPITVYASGDDTINENPGSEGVKRAAGSTAAFACCKAGSWCADISAERFAQPWALGTYTTELAALRAFGRAISGALESHPSPEEIRAYVDHRVPDRAEHAALAAVLESRTLSVLEVHGVLAGLRHRADCLRRGYRRERADEEGLREVRELVGWPSRAPSVFWDRACEAYDRARGLR